MEKKKILIIDDEPLYLEMLKMRLEATGYDVVGISNGQEGLGVAQKEKPDLVLTDINLFDVGGFEISKALKSNKDTQNIKVFVCTNKLAAVNVREARKSMADEFIDKSSDYTILLKAIRRFI
jgi:DNA-binding response OmpR family regulator